MKKAFMVGAKLLGILVLYWSIGTIVQIGFAVTTVSRSSGDAHLQSAWWLMGSIAYSALSFLLAYLLLFRTETIAAVFRIQDDDNTPAFPSADRIVYSGTILIAVYIILVSIPDLARHVFITVGYKRLFMDFANLAQLLEALLKVGMALWILKNPGKAVSLILKGKDRNTDPAT